MLLLGPIMRRTLTTRRPAAQPHATKAAVTPCGERGTPSLHLTAIINPLAGNKLPKVVHQALSASDLKPGRLIVIGDVHG